MKNDKEHGQVNSTGPLRSVESLLNNMGFEVVKNPFEPEKDILVKNQSGSFKKMPPKPGTGKGSQILVYTDDCLNDYFILRSSGIIFLKEPHYIEEGLAAEFADAHGNYYKMLEKRTYEDD